MITIMPFASSAATASELTFGLLLRSTYLRFVSPVSALMSVIELLSRVRRVRAVSPASALIVGDRVGR